MTNIQNTSIIEGIDFRYAGEADVPAMAACRLNASADPADPRMAAYFRGEHHPGCALPPRIGCVASSDRKIIAYAAGHLTTRHKCAGEVQYLFVAPEFRRRGIGSHLLCLLALWFLRHSAAKVCVNVNVESPPAEPFYRDLGAQPLSPEKRFWYVWENIETLIPRLQTSNPAAVNHNHPLG